ncbi:hypothetical protein UFOVP1663_21 [uncultured Caudovirales phage]|uniref:Uncharacterized protein n=1 Tax=uncultured Caudovirales phage TaxID=2100421 RepID=A0A6J5PIF1_9CAUD|nr:hypothetical protein UFOVP871_21 [uncultured Caudovirales phage]CAB4223268.1 hypothetical protein UFOVP1663_21 [uncultured Caudovirales phage]
MATQWTAGTTSGQVLTAATLNTIGAAWVDYTPTLTQSATVTKNITNARYCQIQKTVFVQVYLIGTSAGTAGNILKIGLPIAARAANSSTTGIGQFYDASTNIIYVMSAYLDSTTACAFLYQTGNPYGISPAITAASSDQFQMNITYEVA